MSDSPYKFLRTKKGARERATTEARGEPVRVIADREDKDDGKGFLPTQPMGTVGLSVTVGFSTEYARQKLEISAWETRPVTMDPGDRERVKQEIAATLVKEVDLRVDAAVHEFFPHWIQNDDGDYEDPNAD
tara:strand:+ start:69 stop:461 length:393 start_codon:yes stop_codon:yes gene_type:complete